MLPLHDHLFVLHAPVVFFVGAKLAKLAYSSIQDSRAIGHASVRERWRQRFIAESGSVRRLVNAALKSVLDIRNYTYTCSTLTTSGPFLKRQVFRVPLFIRCNLMLNATACFLLVYVEHIFARAPEIRRIKRSLDFRRLCAKMLVFLNARVKRRNQSR